MPRHVAVLGELAVGAAAERAHVDRAVAARGASTNATRATAAGSSASASSAVEVLGAARSA